MKYVLSIFFMFAVYVALNAMPVWGVCVDSTLLGCFAGDVSAR